MALPGAWAIVVAGGTGSRFGGYKQFATLAGRQVLDWSLETARKACEGVVLVVPAGMVEQCRGSSDRTVVGGSSRSASVRCGLSAVPAEATVVVVHDAARPLASLALWEAAISAVVAGADGAVPCVPVTDTIKISGPEDALSTLDRSRLLAVQTPQAFSAQSLREAHDTGREATDDSALVELIGGRVVAVKGETANLKVTSRADLIVAEALVASRGPS